MSSRHNSSEVSVPLWAVLSAMGAIGASAFGWLFVQIADLQGQIIELHKLIHELNTSIGM